MNRHPCNLYSFGRDAIINQLPLGLFARNQIEPHVIASPAAPEAIARVCDNRYERNPVCQSKLFQNACYEVLCERMNAYDYVRTPALEKVLNVTDRSIVEELSGFRAKAVNSPVKIFHPVLLAAKQPVVYADQLFRYRVRLFYRAHNPNGVRLA